MLRMVNLLIALSLGVHREQLLQRMGLTWPRPFLLRPLFFLFLTILAVWCLSVRRGGKKGLILIYQAGKHMVKCMGKYGGGLNVLGELPVG